MSHIFARCTRFSHGRRFFDSRNVQKRATKSDTSGHCLKRTNAQHIELNHHVVYFLLVVFEANKKLSCPDLQEAQRRSKKLVFPGIL